MAIYTVHVPENAADAVALADGTVFVREGFSARGFFFGLLFLLWNRLWIPAVVWAVALVCLGVVAVLLHPPAFFVVALFGLMHLYLGFEGADLRRGRLARHGWPMRDIVLAPGTSEAELLYFTRNPPPAAPVPPAATRWTALSAVPAVIGMFPDESMP